MVVSCCTSLSLTEMVFLTGKNHFKDLQHVLYQPSKFLLEQICLTLLPKGANITYAHAKTHTHTTTTVWSAHHNNTKIEELGAA